MIYSNLRHLVKRVLLRSGFYKYPDFIIIGAQKAGTTYLYSVLRQHPQIIEPVHKEAHFFDEDKNYDKGVFQYHLNFDLSYRFSKSQITFEATPDYLAHPLVPERIHNLLPKVKLIVLLREPVSRAYSAWKMHHYTFKDHQKYNNLYDPRSFEEVVEEALSSNSNKWNLLNHIGRGLYGMQLTNLFKFFPKDQVLVLFQKDLLENTQNTLNIVTDYLSIRTLAISSVNMNDNRFWENKSQKIGMNISKDIEEKLSNYYVNDKMILEKILAKKINW